MRSDWWCLESYTLFSPNPLSNLFEPSRTILNLRLKNLSLGILTRNRIVVLRRGNARHRLKHVATRHHPAGPHTDIQCRNRRRHNNFAGRFEAHIHGDLGFCTSRRAARWRKSRHCECLVAECYHPKHFATRLPPAEAPEAHAEFFFAAGANGRNMHHWLSARRIATASDSSSSKVHRRESQLTTVPIKPHIYTLPR